jgi:hypothetical protein
MVVKPYEETQVAHNIKQRTFREDADNSDLCWHRDAEDRTVRVLEGAGWSLQLDNSLPMALVPGRDYFIPEAIYHRLIKGKSDLIVEITQHSK